MQKNDQEKGIEMDIEAVASHLPGLTLHNLLFIIKETNKEALNYASQNLSDDEIRGRLTLKVKEMTQDMRVTERECTRFVDMSLAAAITCRDAYKGSESV